MEQLERREGRKERMMESVTPQGVPDVLVQSLVDFNIQLKHIYPLQLGFEIALNDYLKAAS